MSDASRKSVPENNRLFRVDAERNAIMLMENWTTTSSCAVHEEQRALSGSSQLEKLAGKTRRSRCSRGGCSSEKSHGRGNSWNVNPVVGRPVLLLLLFLFTPLANCSSAPRKSLRVQLIANRMIARARAVLCGLERFKDAITAHCKRCNGHVNHVQPSPLSRVGIPIGIRGALIETPATVYYSFHITLR